MLGRAHELIESWGFTLNACIYVCMHHTQKHGMRAPLSASGLKTALLKKEESAQTLRSVTGPQYSILHAQIPVGPAMYVHVATRGYPSTDPQSQPITHPPPLLLLPPPPLHIPPLPLHIHPPPPPPLHHHHSPPTPSPSASPPAAHPPSPSQ